VAAEDAFGNVDPTFGGTISLTLAVNSGSGALGGTTQATAQGGLASFPAVTISQGGAGYALEVSSPGLAPALTRAITLIVVAPATTVVSVGLRSLPVARHRTTRAVVIGLSALLDPASASNVAAYTLDLVTPPRAKKHRLVAVAIASAVYNAATDSVTLTPRKPLAAGTVIQLLVHTSALLDALGRPVAGNGAAGGDYLTTIGKSGA
jgi:hypothetical protein